MKKIASVVLALAFLAAGCSKSATTGDSGSEGRINSFTIPHVLRYTTAEDISSLNPLLSSQGTLSLMSSLTMAWLIKWDLKNSPIPELATEVPTMANGGVSKDGLTITYHLRKGAKWSDGVPFNADDVVFSIHAVLNPANNVTSRSGWDRIKTIDEPDKYTVVLHLSKPYSPFVETFFSSAGANPSLLPKHLLAQYPNLNHVAYNALPVGIGPFKYKAWERGSRVVMVANPSYFRGLPKLKEVDFEIITDRNTVLTQLQAKAIDMWYPVPGNYLQRVQALPEYAVLRHPSFYFNHLDFNISRPAMSDVNVRRALRYATDRQTILTKVDHGVGILQDEPAPKSAAYYDPKIALVPFDIAKANQILDQAGWQRGPDGVRAKNGVRLSLDLATSTGSPDTDEIIELLRGWWKQVGVQISVHHYVASMLFAPYADGGIVYNGKWDVILFAWGLDPIGDLSNLYACDQIPPLGQNDLHWCNPKANTAMHALYAHYDQPQRNADDATVMEELDTDVPMIVENGREDVFVVNKDLKNFDFNAASQFDDFMNVDI